MHHSISNSTMSDHDLREMDKDEARRQLDVLIENIYTMIIQPEKYTHEFADSVITTLRILNNGFEKKRRDDGED